MNLQARIRYFINSRLLRGISANFYSQAIQIVLQVATVPVFVSHWGARSYGIWLMLFTVPAYLALADFGFSGAAANDMTANVVRKDYIAAAEIFWGTRIFVTTISIVFLVIAAIIIYLSRIPFISNLNFVLHARARPTLMFLVIYGLVSIQNGVTLAGFRSVGSYALGTMLGASFLLVENLTALVAVKFGAGLETVALDYMSVRFLNTAMLVLILRIKASWLFSTWRLPSIVAFRRIIWPALAVMVLPLALALSLQGTVLVVGLAAGAIAVPAFATSRTLSRVATQLTSIVNLALMPEFTMAAAANDTERKTRLVFLNFLTTAAILLPVCIVMIFFGRYIVNIWTRGAIKPTETLLVAMGVATFINGLWYPVANLLLAQNVHARYTYFYLMVTIVSLLIAYPLSLMFGAIGAALALILLESSMLIRIFQQARKADVLNIAELKSLGAVYWLKCLSSRSAKVVHR